MQFADNSV